MADTNQPTQSHTRGLQYIYVQEHGAWVFIWAVDDGELDRNLRIAYAVVPSPASFSPQSGQFILTQATADAYTYVYGVPYRAYSVGGSVKVLFTDLTPALGNPRQALGETSPDATTAGKTPDKSGWCLEGQWCKGDLTNGPILWTLKDNNLHNHSCPVIEVTDVADVSGGNNGPGAPCSSLMVQYERDNTGRIITDTNGIPQIAQITGGNTNTAQNYKIGYAAFTFVPNYFGVGLHGWIGASAEPPGPFDFTSIDTNGMLTIFPGTINNLLPSDPLATVDCSAGGTLYITLSCTTDSNQVNQANYVAQSTAPTPAAAIMGAPPASFDVLLGIVVGTASGGNTTYTPYKTLPKGNLLATPYQWILTDKDEVQPYGLPYDIWYTWTITSTLNITYNS